MNKRTRKDSPALDAFSISQSDIPSGGSLDSLRADAWEAYRSLPFPQKDDEAWRRMDWREFPRNLSLAKSSPLPTLPAKEESYAGYLLLSSGNAKASIDDALAAQGILFCDFRTAEREHAEILRRFAGTLVPPQEDKFAALTSALAEDGALLYLPKNTHVEMPFRLLRWVSSEGAHFSRFLVVLEEGASATLFVESASRNGIKASFHAGISEVFLGKGATLHLIEIQNFGSEMWHFSRERVRAARGASLEWVYGALGARTSKNFLSLELNGEDASGRVSGFYLADENQHLDCDTRQDHLAPHTQSDLLFKGALKGKSHSVWSGMIYVSPKAQQTDGYQSAHALLLGEDARADTIPGLEILADDVRCSHGATVGKVDEELLFYLATRGIPRAEAERLAVEGFFEPVLQRIPSEHTQTRIRAALAEKIAAKT